MGSCLEKEKGRTNKTTGDMIKKERVLFLFIIIILLANVFPETVFAQQVICAPPPSQVPLFGTFTINCTVSTGVGWFLFGWCPSVPFLKRQIVTKLTVSYQMEEEGISDFQSFECSSATCIVSERSISFNSVGRWRIEFCGWRECYYAGYLDNADYKCLPSYFIEVLPPRCGDGVVNQPWEECDPPGGNCDSNCQLIGGGGPTQPTQPTGYDNPLLWANIPQFLLYALRFIFNVLLGVSILMIVIAGIFLAVSRGDPIRQAKGKRTLLFAVLGFAIAFLAQGLFMLFKVIFGVRF